MPERGSTQIDGNTTINNASSAYLTGGTIIKGAGTSSGALLTLKDNTGAVKWDIQDRGALDATGQYFELESRIGRRLNTG